MPAAWPAKTLLKLIFVFPRQMRVGDKEFNYVFSKDRDFREFLKTPQAKQVASTLGVRKGPSNGAAEEPAKKLVAGVESTTAVPARSIAF